MRGGFTLMGYRLDASCDSLKTYLYGTKLYGYLNDEDFKKLKSAKYLGQVLYDNNLESRFNVFWLCPSCDLSASQFRTFMRLYIADKEEISGIKFDPEMWFNITWKEFNEFMLNEDTKHLTWD